MRMEGWPEGIRGWSSRCGASDYDYIIPSIDWYFDVLHSHNSRNLVILVYHIWRWYNTVVQNVNKT